jgi:ketosteroid isomerase-like protein
VDGDAVAVSAPESTLVEARLELVRRMIDAFNRRDMEAMLEQADEDFEYDWSRSLGLYAEVYRGPEGFKRFVDEQWSMFDEFRVEAHEFIPRGHCVVVPCTVYATGRDGVPVSANSVHLYTFEDDRIVRITLFQEREEALEAAYA